jgi:uncharacterized membrane protein YgdD (TMEM256/DUF423 family)
MTGTIVVMLAGLMGAGGVVLLAAGAHAAPGAGLDSAGSMLLFHAAATVGLAAALGQGLLWRPLAIAAVFGLMIGATVFAGDLALRAFAGHRLFPMAAPTGGVVMIVAWLAVPVAAGAALLRP